MALVFFVVYTFKFKFIFSLKSWFIVKVILRRWLNPLQLFEFILLLLTAVSLSNLVHRFIPSVSIPIIQIVLGMAITLLPLHYELTLDPELFVVLFIAPLLFNDGKLANKEALWELRKPILWLALGLVFMTVAALGYFLNWLLPVIPLAASFALAAALAPTDAIAVGALEEKIKIPHQTMKMLEGESLINDASGLVSFQFAVAAMVTGVFSFKHAGLSFIGISLGGIVLGLLLTFVKYLLVRWLRSLGMENVTLHMLIEIITPFAIFIAAEKVGVNGILAVVSAGIAHSFGFKKLHPELAMLRVVSKSTWSVIIFILNGAVFLLLGTQLPDIIQTIWDSSEIGNLQVIFYSLVITVFVLGLRLLWVLGMDIRRGGATGEPWRVRMQHALIVTLSGVRGTITLVSALSLPLFLDNGLPFPARDLIIFLAAGVIIWTLLGANYLLPLLVGTETAEEQGEDEAQAKIDILRNVVAGLNEQITDKNKLAVGLIMDTYKSRIQKLQNNTQTQSKERALGIVMLKWEKKRTLIAISTKEINAYTAHRYLKKVNRLLLMYTREAEYKKELSSLRNWPRSMELLQQAAMSFSEKRAELKALRILVCTYVLKQLNELLAGDEWDIEIVSSMAIHYEKELAVLYEAGAKFSKKQEIDSALYELSRIGIQLERDQIQNMFETGRIRRAVMKELKNNISIMEHDLREDAL